jgi:Contractile injection system tube protein/LysM domain
MPLEKLTIIPERGATIQALFNPERYTVSKSVQLAEVTIPGLDAPVVQFVRGQNEKITMELFFDTTDHGMADNVADVRELTTKVYKLLKVDGELHAPPRVLLSWGTSGQLTSHGTTIPPWLVLESVSEEFSLFSPAGIPLRAKLNVSFREAWTIQEQLQITPRHSSDRTKLHRVVRGENISQIADSEYNDPRQWRPIADANNLDNPRLLAPGTVLEIPRNTSMGTSQGRR